MTKRLSLTLALCFALSGSLFAQNGSIQGLVTDTTGRSIPGAKVVAIDQDKQLTARETTTGSEGTFALRPLLPGKYTVKVQATGFKALERTDLVLDQNQIMSLGNVAMQIGDTVESITVNAEVPLVES